MPSGILYSIRDNWLWLLYLLIPIYAARLLLYRRLLTLTPLTPWMLLYVVLVVFNIGLGLYLASGWRSVRTLHAWMGDAGATTAGAGDFRCLCRVWPCAWIDTRPDYREHLGGDAVRATACATQ
ncbi:MAG: hypothetical protein U0694_27130 [Anaerolineae bacterium]